jgi:two-component system NtrC family response regulator
MANVLIIDDDETLCEALSLAVTAMGHNVMSAQSLKEGLKKALSNGFDIVFLDVRMPDGDGLGVLPRIREAPSSPEVIIMTGFGDPDGAELAIKSGAWDYIEKPSSLRAMTLPLVRALQYREEKRRRPPKSLKREGILGSSPQMRGCFDLLAQAAESDANVLITGETGTGKEIFARAIHENSSWAGGSFVVVDCTVLPETLIESALFGHEKGAFTGADRTREGLIKQADCGTLFLDEVGELNLSLQKAFLRVLQERRFRPIGGKKEISSSFRLIAATNKNLSEMVQKGQLREDLLHRLRSITIELPPLRDRREDINSLVFYYTAKLCTKSGLSTKGFSPELLTLFAAYDWPGNVRELVNTLERALAAARDEPILFPKHLPNHIRIQAARASISREVPAEESVRGNIGSPKTLPELRELREQAIAEVERRYLRDLISLTRGDIEKACQISGLQRARLYQLFKKYRLGTRLAETLSIGKNFENPPDNQTDSNNGWQDV